MKVVALSGGVGGAKLAFGLNRMIASDDLTIIANTGDDFCHHGLPVSPDIDTLIYTLSGLNDDVRGWGLRDETWAFMGALEKLGGETWFNLGDRDLAMHVLRREAFDKGQAQLTIMSQAIKVTGFRFEGVAEALPPSGLLSAIQEADRIVICPSNPFISIDPILAVPGIRHSLIEASAPVIAISPIVNGEAIKGPTAKMFKELGSTPSPIAVAEKYKDFLNVMVIDETDVETSNMSKINGVEVEVAQTIMRTDADKVALAEYILRL